MVSQPGKGLAYIKVNQRSDLKEGLQSPIEIIPENIIDAILTEVDAQDGDIVFFGAGTDAVVCRL